MLLGALPLPRTKIVQFDSSISAPAPLDELSLWNGVRKFTHEQVSLTSEEIDYALEVLNVMFPNIAHRSTVVDANSVSTAIRHHSEKSAGWPWNMWGCPTKEQAVEQFGIDAVERYYLEHSTIISSTLKDEIRSLGKDARFFRPQDVSSYVEGVRLFYDQNDYLMGTLHSTPIACRYVIPGRDVSRLFRDVERFSPGRCFAADGSAWDANFPLAFAEVIACFRSAGYTLPTTDRVVRYYSMMYNGYTNVAGHLYGLVGQPSGHHNTSTDNCLGHIVAMSVIACRHKIELRQFVESIRFRCCGDDLLYSTRDERFYALPLQAAYEALGVYLEFEFADPHCASDLSFVGCRIHVRSDGHWMPYLTEDRVKMRRPVVLRGQGFREKLSRLCSLAIMCYGNEDVYNSLVSEFEDVVSVNVLAGLLDASDPVCGGLRLAMRKDTLENAYLRFEGVPFSLFRRIIGHVKEPPIKSDGFDYPHLRRS